MIRRSGWRAVFRVGLVMITATALAGLAGVGPAAAQTGSTAFDLAGFNGSTSVATRINDSGQVVGFYSVGGSYGHADLDYVFSWTAGGGMVGPISLGGRSFNPFVNSSGLIVGTSEFTAVRPRRSRVFVDGRRRDR